MKSGFLTVALVLIAIMPATAAESKLKKAKDSELVVGKTIETVEGDVGCRTSEILGGYLEVLLAYRAAQSAATDAAGRGFNEGYYGASFQKYSGECSDLTEGIDVKIIKIKDLEKKNNSIVKANKAVLVKLPTGMTTFVAR